MNATYTYRFASDSAQQSIEAHSADEAAAIFDPRHPTIWALGNYVVGCDGWLTIESDDDPEFDSVAWGIR
jgi:hypothetical protein